MILPYIHPSSTAVTLSSPLICGCFGAVSARSYSCTTSRSRDTRRRDGWRAAPPRALPRDFSSSARGHIPNMSTHRPTGAFEFPICFYEMYWTGRLLTYYHLSWFDFESTFVLYGTGFSFDTYTDPVPDPVFFLTLPKIFKYFFVTSELFLEMVD